MSGIGDHVWYFDTLNPTVCHDALVTDTHPQSKLDLRYSYNNVTYDVYRVSPGSAPWEPDTWYPKLPGDNLSDGQLRAGG